MELAERMRLENHEQFQTLVRMHLSFELDLHTDDNEATPLGDGKPETAGGKFRKRFHFNKKPKTPAAPKSGHGPSPVLSPACIGQMRQLMEFLMLEQNVIQEGIFRRTGSVARQTELKARVVCGDAAAIATAAAAPLPLDSGIYTVHDCASVLKGVLADLPEPLLTDTYAPAAHQQMAELCNNRSASEDTTAAAASGSTSTSTTKTQRLLHALQLLILLLPAENRQLLQEIITMLHHTMQHEPSNKMSADSLATLFTPHLICPKTLTPEALHATAANLSGIISFMITRGAAIFECPPKLATDIRAYFAEQRRKQTLSPEQILDESVTSDSTANTVYTFVDRERTAQAHDQNPTDTCLAQLYAYIQSLPESSKKRKLIKQFNKENGQGTPLQVQKLHRLKMIGGGGGDGGNGMIAGGGSGAGGGSATKASGAGKSLGDSIKRHIFQKNLLARTPKPASSSSALAPMLLPQSVPAFAMPSSLAGGSRSGKSGGFNTPTNLAGTPHQLKSSLPAHLHPQSQLNARALFQSPASVNTPPSRGMTPAAAKAVATPLLAKPTETTSRTSPGASSDRSSSVSITDESGDQLECSEFELLSETITQLQQGQQEQQQSAEATVTTKKSVAFRSDAAEEPSDRENLRSAAAALKSSSRFRSEPNLTNILGERNGQTPQTPSASVPKPTTTIVDVAPKSERQSGGRYIANKLLKGVSMVNLRLPSLTSAASASATPASIKASMPAATPKTPVPLCVTPPKRHQPKIAAIESEAATNAAEMLVVDEDEDIDDPDFVATPQSQRSLSNYSRRYSADGDYADIVTPTTRATSHGHASLLLSHQQQHLQHMISGRRSMSPITKSTQRMSKAMQESIMTPRSRKPVMLTGALLAEPSGSNAAAAAQQQQQQSFGSIREQDEEDELFDRSASARLAVLYKSKSEGDFSVLLGNGQQSRSAAFFGDGAGNDEEDEAIASGANNGCLSSPFKDYLLRRSVVSDDSPVDSSFSSQPDDFGSTPDMQTLADTEPTDLSDSLLYCLDGNQPSAAVAVSQLHHAAAAVGAAGLQRTGSNSSRKRANGGAEDGSADAAEERQYFDELHPKKVTVTSGTIGTDCSEHDGPGETSL